MLTDNQDNIKLYKTRNLDFKSDQRFKHENFIGTIDSVDFRQHLALQLKNLSKTIGIKNKGENYRVF